MARSTQVRFQIRPFILTVGDEKRFGKWCHEIGPRLREHVRKFGVEPDPESYGYLVRREVFEALREELRRLGAEAEALQAWR